MPYNRHQLQCAGIADLPEPANLLPTTGKVSSALKISSTVGGLTGPLDDDDLFGISVAVAGDLNGDRVPDLLVGAFQDDDGGMDRGAVWVLFLEAR